MINDLVLRLVVTAVFCVAIAGYSYLLVAQHGRLSGTVNYLLHLVMLIAMVVMAWSARTNIPAAALTVFFLIAGIWFLGVLAALAAWHPGTSCKRLPRRDDGSDGVDVRGDGRRSIG